MISLPNIDCETADPMMEETQAFLRRIKRKKIQVPTKSQFVSECQYSKTGWGIWNKATANSYAHCTCIPARKPS